MEKIVIKRRDLNKIIKNIAEMQLKKEWRSEDSRPAVLNEPPLEMDAAVIDPKAENQPSDESMPIEDRHWIPGNKSELGKAMKQLAEHIPESEIQWFYSRLKRLLDKAIDQVDGQRMQPRIDSSSIESE